LVIGDVHPQQLVVFGLEPEDRSCNARRVFGR
jgi:hypothetical protein